MTIHTTRATTRTFFVTLTLLLIALPALAMDGPGQRSTALGISNFAGPSTGDAVQLITGWDEATVYTSTGGFGIQEDGIVLRRNGLYQVAVEGLLFFDADDGTAPDEAAGLYSVAFNGFEIGVCQTPANGNVPTLPVDWQNPGYERAAKCEVTFTIKVKGDGDLSGFPLTFPRGTLVQVNLWPNDLPLGDATLRLVRLEITKIGP